MVMVNDNMLLTLSVISLLTFISCHSHPPTASPGQLTPTTEGAASHSQGLTPPTTGRQTSQLNPTTERSTLSPGRLTQYAGLQTLTTDLTDIVPETSADIPVAVSPRSTKTCGSKRRMPSQPTVLLKPELKKCCKLLVNNVHSYCRIEKQAFRSAVKRDRIAADRVLNNLKSLNQPRARVSKMTGLHTRTIDRFHHQEQFDETLSPQKSRKCGNRPLPMPEWTLGAIRTIITHMYGMRGGNKANCRYPTVKNVRHAFYQAYNAEPKETFDVSRGDIPIVGKERFRQLIRQAGYKFVSSEGGRAILKSRDEAALDLLEYLRAVFCLRYKKDDYGKLQKTGRVFVYMDETWVNRNHHRALSWKKIIDTGRYVDAAGKVNLLPAAYDGEFDLPAGKGERFIIIHYMTEDGLIEAAGKVFRGKKVTDNYHDEMNGQHFEEHLRESVLPVLPENCVLVIDKASYHNRMTESSKKPSSSWPKTKLVEWLLSQKTLPDHLSSRDNLKSLTNAELLNICGKLNVKPEYIVDRICAEKNIKVLRLPTKHCELNPIELVWAKVKSHIADHNIETASMDRVHELIKEGFKSITADFCKKCVEHVQRIEHSRYDAEIIMDTLVDEEKARRWNLKFTVTGSDEESDSEKEDEDEDDIETVPAIPMSAEAKDELQILHQLMVQEALVYGSTTAIKKAVVHCNCKSDGCKKSPCSCRIANISCNSLCKCKGLSCHNKVRESRAEDTDSIDSKQVSEAKAPSTSLDLVEPKVKGTACKCGSRRNSGAADCTSKRCSCIQRGRKCTDKCKCKNCFNKDNQQKPSVPPVVTPNVLPKDTTTTTTTSINANITDTPYITFAHSTTTPTVLDLDPPPFVVGRHLRSSLRLHDVPGDGACLFSAIQQLTGTEDLELRTLVAREIIENPLRYDHELFEVNAEGQDVRLSPMEYATRIMGSTYWGGFLDARILAQQLNVNLAILHIHPQERPPYSITRTNEAASGPICSLLLRNNHYQWISQEDGGRSVTFDELRILGESLARRISHPLAGISIFNRMS